MSIQDVKRVMEIGQHESHGVGGEMWGVNEYLAEGWVLLNVHSVSGDSDNGPTQHAEYVLGWPGAAEPPSDQQKRIDAEKGRAFVERMRAAVQEERPPK